MNRFFSLLISAHEILNSEPTILKLDYVLSVIHSYSLQRWFISTVCNEHVYKLEACVSEGQQWIVFSLLLGTHEILNTTEPTILKFNYVLCLLRSYSMQRWFISTDCNKHDYKLELCVSEGKQWIIFSLLISAHEILNSEPTILKFNYVFCVIHS